MSYLADNLVPDSQLCLPVSLDTAPILNQISTDYETLYNNREYADITLIIGSQQVSAHKAILAARSQVFANMFKTKNEIEEEKKNSYEITGVSMVVFEKLMRFIYCGKVESFDGLEGEMLVAADKVWLIWL